MAKVVIYGATYIDDNIKMWSPNVKINIDYWEEVNLNQWYFDEEHGKAFKGAYLDVLEGKLKHKPINEPTDILEKSHKPEEKTEFKLENLYILLIFAAFWLGAFFMHVVG